MVEEAGIWIYDRLTSVSISNQTYVILPSTASSEFSLTTIDLIFHFLFSPSLHSFFLLSFLLSPSHCLSFLRIPLGSYLYSSNGLCPVFHSFYLMKRKPAHFVVQLFLSLLFPTRLWALWKKASYHTRPFCKVSCVLLNSEECFCITCAGMYRLTPWIYN